MLFSVTMMMVVVTDVGIDRWISKSRSDADKEGKESHENMIRNGVRKSSLLSKLVAYWSMGVHLERRRGRRRPEE